jgi:hypothetical protein
LGGDVASGCHHGGIAAAWRAAAGRPDAEGVLVQEEQDNPVDIELESFFQSCRDLTPPKAGLEIGLRDSVAVIVSNLAMDEGRRVYFNEIDKMGRGEEKAGKGRQTD